MKNNKTALFLIISGLLGLSLTFLALTCSGQSQTFTVLRLADKYGVKTNQEQTKITLSPGFIEITEKGQTWKEIIETQTKGNIFTRITTCAGEYTFLFDGAEIYAVHLRSLIGADRSYLNPLK